MRSLQTILTTLVMLSVFITPLQAGCCMVMPTHPKPEMKVESAGSCCMSKMVKSHETQPQVDQPLAPCKSREGQCPKCTNTVMTQQGCDANPVTVTQESISSHDQLQIHLSLALATLSILEPTSLSQASFAVPMTMPVTTVRSLCAQHTLLTV